MIATAVLLFADLHSVILTAMIYIMHEDRPLGMPTEHYNRICMEGYDDFGLNKLDYMDALMTNFLRMEEKK